MLTRLAIAMPTPIQPNNYYDAALVYLGSYLCGRGHFRLDCLLASVKPVQMKVDRQLTGSILNMAVKAKKRLIPFWLEKTKRNKKIAVVLNQPNLPSFILTKAEWHRLIAAISRHIA